MGKGPRRVFEFLSYLSSNYLKTLLRSSFSWLSWAETDKTVAGSSVAPGNTAPCPSSPTSPTLDATAALEMNNPHAIPRRHAPIEQLARQGSFRGFPALSQKMSPFKRQLSLRINDLPSTMQRKTDFPIKNAGKAVSTWLIGCFSTETLLSLPVKH